MSNDSADQDEWEIDVEIATARHLPTGIVFRYLPVPDHPEMLRPFVVRAHGEFANACNHAAQRQVKHLGEQGKIYYQAVWQGEADD